jgi:DNA-binding CsgD family transcriptional regulator
MNATIRLYPGMCDGNLEFFYHEKKKAVMSINNGQTKNFDELSCREISGLQEIIDSDSKLRKILREWFPDNNRSQMKELAKCRFGGLNFFPDFSENQNFSSVDHLSCKIRGICKGEGVVCKPMEYEGNILDFKEIKTIKLLSSGKKNYEIAEQLNMALGTFNVFKNNLYEKLNTHNKQELTRVGVKLGIC